VLISAKAREGRLPVVTFPFPAFETCILDLLKEIPASTVAGKNGTTDEVSILSAELTNNERERKELKAWLDGKEKSRETSPTLYERIDNLDAEIIDLSARLAEARRKAAHPRGESWGEFRSLAHALENATDKDETRIRIRTVLRHNVEAIYVVIVPRGRTRLAGVQVFFKGGNLCRSYLLGHHSPWGGPNGEQRAPRVFEPRSLAEVIDSAELDLRRPEDAAALEEVLAEMDLAEFCTEERRF
jgi:hypothetical protein